MLELFQETCFNLRIEISLSNYNITRHVRKDSRTEISHPNTQKLLILSSPIRSSR